MNIHFSRYICTGEWIDNEIHTYKKHTLRRYNVADNAFLKVWVLLRMVWSFICYPVHVQGTRTYTYLPKHGASWEMFCSRKLLAATVDRTWDLWNEKTYALHKQSQKHWGSGEVIHVYLEKKLSKLEHIIWDQMWDICEITFRTPETLFNCCESRAR